VAELKKEAVIEVAAATFHSVTCHAGCHGNSRVLLARLIAGGVAPEIPRDTVGLGFPGAG
jgi:hypothetical protein